jgi:predicted signal transduction protein with EAL and GGDEF domain
MKEFFSKILSFASTNSVKPENQIIARQQGGPDPDVSTAIKLQDTHVTLVLFFICINIMTLTLLPLFIPAISYLNLALPLIINEAIAAVILIFSRYRNRIEKERVQKIAQANLRLQDEIKEINTMKERLAFTALHDPLTDLPNRALFMNRLNHIMERSKRNKNVKYAVFLWIWTISRLLMIARGTISEIYY